MRRGRVSRSRRDAHRGVGYLDRLERLDLLPVHASTRCGCSIAPGFAIVVVTNQAGIARGIVTESFVAEAHRAHRAIASRPAARDDRRLLLLPAPSRRGGRALPIGVRLPQAEAGHAAAARRRISTSISRARSSSATLARPGGRAGGRRPRRARAHRATAHEDEAAPEPADAPPPRSSPTLDGRRGVDPADRHDERPDRHVRRLLALDRRASPGVASSIVGDLIADEFIYGEIARVSREAPVLILNYDSTEVVPGGAGNAANNVAALGGARASGRPGRPRRDRPAAARARCSAARIDVGCVLRPAGYRTPTKTRILAGGVHSAKQQVVRIDRAASAAIDDDDARGVRGARCSRAVRGADALHRVRLRQRPDHAARCWRTALGAARRADGRRSLVDSRYDAARASTGMTACTPNESEVEQALGVRIDDNARALERAGRALLAQTRSPRRAHHARQPRHGALRARPPDRPHSDRRLRSDRRRHRRRRHRDRDDDARARRRARSFEEAARLANYAGGLVVMKRGTATVSASELRYAISGGAVGRAAGSA